LISPIQFGHNAIWIRLPDQKVDASAVTRASFGKDATKDEFASALIYKLQRKNSKSGDQSNADSTFTKDRSTSFQLLVIWRSNDEHSFSVRSLLVKHSNAITWNEDTLEKLHSMYLALLSEGLFINDMPKEDSSIMENTFKDTWLLDDATVLMTTSKWKEENRTVEI
jgi:hypothetical protein